MNIVCSYCNALGFACERKGTIGTPHFGQLRSNGRKAMFQNYLFFPSDLIGLYVDDNEKATYFRKHICYFNSGMAMTSFTAGTEAPVCKYGPAVYRISDVQIRNLYKHTLTLQKSTMQTNQSKCN
jgi:hypothetical protein